MIRLVVLTNPFDLASREVSDVPPDVSILETVPAWALEENAAAVWINAERIPRSEWDTRMVLDGEFVGVRRTVGVEVLPFLIQAVVTFAASYVFNVLFPPPDIGKQRDDKSSPNYGFSGQTNTDREGAPQEVIYGEIRVAGTIIQQALDTGNGSQDTFLKLVIAFGQGPIESIGNRALERPIEDPFTGSGLPDGLEIDGNAAENYDELEVWIRRGTIEQEPLGDFDEIRQLTAVGSALSAPTTASEFVDTYAPGFTVNGVAEFDATNDGYWTSNGVAFDFASEEIDGYVIRVRYPAGYYRQSSTGALEGVSIAWQVRYIELDSGGTPIASGGPAGDGYVRLPVRPLSRFRRREAGELSISGKFLDPQTYTPTVIGKALDLSGAANGTASGAPTGFQNIATGTVVPVWSVAFWVKFDAGELGFAVHGTIIPLVGQISGATRSGTLGWAVYMIYIDDGIFGNGWHIGMRTSASGAPAYRELITAPVFGTNHEGAWIHIGFAWNDNTGTFSAHLYGVEYPVLDEGDPHDFGLNGTPTPREPAWSRTDLSVGHFTDWTYAPSFGLDRHIPRLNGQIDGLVLWQTYISPSSMAGEYAQGFGTTEHVGNPVGVYEFENAAAENAVATDPNAGSDPWYETLVLGAGASSGSVTGVVSAGVLGDRRRSRYRLELVRINEESTSPRVQNKLEWGDVQSVIEAGIAYAEIPYMAMRIRASEQLRGNRPNVTVPVRGREVPIWDRASTATPTAPPGWSANPAWIALDLITVQSVGMGTEFALTDCDLDTFAEWADYCDELISDGRRSVTIDNATDSEVFFFNDGARGLLTIYVDKAESNTLPASWRRGRFINLSGFPGVAEGLGSDLDTPPTLRGYEIKAAYASGTIHRLELHWDRLATDPDPWLSLFGFTTLTSQVATWTGTLQGCRPRFEFHGIFDTLDSDDGMWGALLKVCSVGRAAPVREGRRIRIKYESPREPIDIIGSVSIEPDSWSITYTSPKESPNALEMQILDADYGHEFTPIKVFGDGVEESADSNALNYRSDNLFGVTDRGQAIDHGKFLLRSYALLRRQMRATIGAEAMQLDVGDVVIVAQDLLPRGPSGRLIADTVVSNRTLIDQHNALSGARWTPDNITIAASTFTTPFGDLAGYVGRLTDGSAATLAEVYQDFDLSPSTGLERGNWSVGLIARNDSAARSRFILRWADGSVTGEILWSTGAVTVLLDGVPGSCTAQPMDADWFFITIWCYFDPTSLVDKPRFAIQPAVGIPGSLESDVGTIEVANAIANKERSGAFFYDRRSVPLDREIVIDHATVHRFRCKSALDTMMAANVDPALVPAGTYGVGDVLFLDADLPLPMLRGNIYTIVAPGNELLAQITTTLLNEDLRREVELIEYNEAVFADSEPVEEETSALFADGWVDGRNGALGSDATTRETRLPSNAVSLDVADVLVARTVGAVSVIRFAWTSSENVSGDRVRVWIRPIDTDGAWDSIGEYPLEQGGAEYELASDGVRAEFDVSAQIVSRFGLARTIAGSKRVRYTMTRDGSLPDQPSAATATVIGTRIFLDWTFVDDAQNLGVIWKRGGWQAGDPVLSARGGTRGETSLPFANDPFAVDAGQLKIATVDGAGRTSVPLNVDLLGTQKLIVAEGSSLFVATQWQDFGAEGGWYEGPPHATDEPSPSNLERDGSGFLTFDSGGVDLEGWYTTFQDAATPVVARGGRTPQRLYPVAVFEAQQVHPFDYTALSADEQALLRFERWNAEGPYYLLPGESEISVRIEMSVLADDAVGSSWSAWTRYVPGVVEGVDVRFRLRITRPDTTFDVSVRKFHTAVYRMPAQMDLSDRDARGLEAELYA